MKAVHLSIPSDPGLQRLVRLAVTVAVFGIIGPPVGGLVAWVMMGAAGAHSPEPFVSGSYGEGLSLALATGVVFVVVAAWLGRSSWLVAVGAAILANAVMHATTLDFSVPDQAAALMNVAYVFLPPSIAAALVCWWLTRKLVKR